ncbi:ABC transporter substrate-binding protein [Bosea sp. SSUT16]|jgi:branched-chain amino acid transport system substrate-binding protein|uniref:ABC transporter substrate-binding protein n=1 Tax=Bosea spartocytisi TaxID=2773451 RepID=A0A927I261_9HYPH|nr:ABC transporter substrate-binding protein [Bosea spartocytisi]MBD3848157.1 ABC transporter substrate-binding protein [Bosea spartocytisi]MCT4474007.1 ABC transporter substrate-binding protein [Bosea spartocytisi]
MKGSKFLIGAAVAAALGAQSLSVAKAADPIVIGLFGPMSGERSALGSRFKEAAGMFADELNAAGGIAGRKIEVRVEDTRGNPREAATIAQKFADDPAVLAVLGGQTSTESMAAAPILAEAKIAQVAPTASHPDYVKISPYQFRTTPTQSSMVQPHVDMLLKKLGMKQIAIVYFKDDWGMVTNTLVSKRLKDLGAEVVLSEAMIPETRDFRPLITKIKAAAPDGVFLVSHYAESALFMQQLRQADPALKVAGTDTLNDPKFIELANGAAEGVVMPTQFLADAPEAIKFSKAYEAKFGKEPNYYSAFTWDAMLIVTDAMKVLATAGKPITRQAIRDQIADAAPIQGVSGALKYVGNGDLGERSINYIVVKGKAYQPFN